MARFLSSLRALAEKHLTHRGKIDIVLSQQIRKYEVKSGDGRLKFTSDMMGIIDYEYYRTYPNSLKRKYCNVLSVLDGAASRFKGRQDSQQLLNALVTELVEKNGIEFRYEASYTRELLGHCWSGGCEDEASDTVVKNETLLWYVIEQEYYDVAYKLINQYNARLNLNVKINNSSYFDEKTK